MTDFLDNDDLFLRLSMEQLVDHRRQKASSIISQRTPGPIGNCIEHHR